MIDTIYIDFPWENVEGLHRRCDTIDRETGQVLYSTGYIDCIKIKKINGIMRIECSLPKLLKGNNIYSLDYYETKEALYLLERILSINIRNGIIRRIDFGVSVLTAYKPENYFKYFSSSSYYVRSLTNKSSLYYKNGNRQKYFYDKTKEIKSRGGIIPTEFTNKNIFKFECRYGNSSIIKNFGSLNVKSIMKKEIFIHLAQLALMEYNSIQKINIPIFDKLNISSKANFLQQLASIAVNHLGTNEVIEMINATKTIHSDIRKEYYSRRKNDILKLLKHPMMRTPNLINEINNKIELKIAEITCIE